MINKQTQNAWLAYMRSQAGNAKFLIAKDYDSGVVQDIEKPVRDGFDAGYAAASAERDALRDELQVAYAGRLGATHRAEAAEVERDALRAQVERLREVMGEEWPTDTKEDDPAWFYPPACPECYRSPDVGHEDYCSRGRFFAALAGIEVKP